MRTPVPGSSPAFSEKQHFKALNGALLEVAPAILRGNSSPNTAGSSIAEDYNADVEDHYRERTLVGSTTRHRKRKNPSAYRLSWLGVSKDGDTHHADHIEEQGRKVVTPTVSVGDHTHAESSNSHSSQHGKHAFEPNLIDSEGHERAQYPRYPPTSRAGISSNGQNSPLLESGSKYNLSDSVPFKAAKMIKHAILHDARNLSGTAGDSEALAWNVNSAHEAKVVIPYNRNENRLRIFSSFGSAWHVRSTLVSKHLVATGSFLQILIPPTTMKLTPRKPSKSSTKTTTKISPEPKSKPLYSRSTRNAGFSLAQCVMSARLSGHSIGC